MLKVQPEQDRVKEADQVFAAEAGPCPDIAVETDLNDQLLVTEAELRAVAWLLGSEVEAIFGLLR